QRTEAADDRDHPPFRLGFPAGHHFHPPDRRLMDAIETGANVKQIKSAACIGQGIYRAFLAASLIALLPAALLPAAAQDEEKPRWFGSSFDNRTTVLAYGIPDSDYIMLSFSCKPGKPVVSVNVQDEESRAEEGATMQVYLSA